MSRALYWCFTVQSWENEPVYDENVHQYLIFGRETAPQTGRRHLQGYVAFKERKRLTQLKAWIPGAHFERARGSPTSNKEYCSKDGDFREYGTLPRVERRVNPFADVLSAAERGDLSSIKEKHPGLYLRYKANICSSLRFRTQELADSCGIWICGPPRCGKDLSVRKLGSVYAKMPNKWWDGYAGEDNILMSDIEPSHGAWLGFFLKIWSDRYPFTAEIKGSCMQIRPLKFFVTSNFQMEACFSGEVLNALLARFTQIDMFCSPPRVAKRPTFASPAVITELLRDVEAITSSSCTEKEASVTPEQAPSTSAVSSEEARLLKIDSESR